MKKKKEIKCSKCGRMNDAERRVCGRCFHSLSEKKRNETKETKKNKMKSNVEIPLFAKAILLLIIGGWWWIIGPTCTLFRDIFNEITGYSGVVGGLFLCFILSFFVIGISLYLLLSVIENIPGYPHKMIKKKKEKMKKKKEIKCSKCGRMNDVERRVCGRCFHSLS